MVSLLILYLDITIDCVYLTMRAHPKARKGVHCYMFGDFLNSKILAERAKVLSKMRLLFRLEYA